MLDRQIEGLKKKARQKKLIAWQKTEKAINNLINNRQKITIAAVARAAGVSTSYIYKYPELSYRIQRLREQQKYEVKDLGCSDDKPLQIEKRKSDRVNNLEKEKAELTQKLKLLDRSINQILNSDNTVENLKAQNIKLTIENQELNKRLQKLEQEVYQLRGVILDRGYQDREDTAIEINRRQKVVSEIYDEVVDISIALPKRPITTKHDQR